MTLREEIKWLADMERQLNDAIGQAAERARYDIVPQIAGLAWDIRNARLRLESVVMQLQEHAELDKGTGI